VKLKVQIKGNGFPILCLHGHPGSGACMDIFSEYLANNFQTFSPDLRGYGKTIAKEPFSLEDHLTDLVELLDSYQIEKCLLLGWSLGGILALELLIRYPERFSGMVLVASAAYPRGNHPPISFWDLANTAIAAILNLIKPGWQWNIDTFAKRSLFRYLVSKQTPNTYLYLAKYAVPAYLRTSRFAHNALNQAIGSGYNRLPALEKIKVPILVLSGQDDRHISAQSSQETAKYIENCLLYCYPNTAHLFPWEIPDEVLQDLGSWLKKYPEVVKKL
jgi:pimeloyl-ACP methyl ester carboxylesterase